MDAHKRKVTAKLTPPEHNAGATLSSPTPPPLVRAKISGTARARTRTTSAVSAPPSQSSALRPVASSITARRSPSPSKMQAHLQPNRPVRATLSKAASSVERTRHGSISSMLSIPAQSSSSAPPTPITLHNGDTSHTNANTSNGSLRVKAKVSGLAKAKSASAAPSPSGVPDSLSAILSPPSPSPPINTTFHHRSVSTVTLQTSAAQLVPLPTSPPASTLSFSSRSSTSASSPSHARTDSRSMSALAEAEDTSLVSPPLPPPPQRSLVARVRPGTHISGGRGSVSGSMSLGSTSVLDLESSSSSDTGDEGEEADTRGQPLPGDEHDEERAEAKSNRKIADLEITTRSLLAINASLEAAKVRQARELRDLRRRLRETRLILPPRAFRQLRDSTPVEPEEGDPEDSAEEEEEEEGEVDETFARLRLLVEGLLDTGRKALAVACPKPRLEGIDGEDGVGRPEVLGWEGGGKHGVAIGSRVLSPEEAGWWVEHGEAQEREHDRDDTPVGFARHADGDDHLHSGDAGS